jgi:undecaprenyl diphosphate synthase
VTPQHVAIIMDGNRRWARERGLPIACGYRRGVTALRRTLRAARRAQVRIVTAYAFSEENWNRPSSEVDLLMSLCIQAAGSELQALVHEGVRVRLCGREDRLPPRTRSALGKLVAQTAGNTAVTLYAPWSAK